MLNYLEVQEELKKNPRKWLVTGCAGFVGSNICHKLLELGQEVTGLDNMSIGQQNNIDELNEKYPSFNFHKGDIRDLETLRKLITGKDHVLHQAALGSVPRSIAHPWDSHDSNVNGLFNVLMACHELKVPLVYASSSSVYGDHPDLPKVEDKVGFPLSPYAATKSTKELYAKTFARTYNVQVMGLRYFNVFGPRQRPDGPYAAVIAKWMGKILEGETVEIYGDGKTSRDFCYIANAVQANIMAAFHGNEKTSGEVYNVAAQKQTDLNRLLELIIENYNELGSAPYTKEAVYKDFRPGDVRHSLAEVAKAEKDFAYQPTHNIEQGLTETVQWFMQQAGQL